jgi:hypothetical protein
MPRKFVEIKVGEPFTALGERYIKTGPLTYRSIDNPTMGEYTAGPILDRQIDVEPKSGINTRVIVTKDPEVDAVDQAIKQGQTTPIKKTKKSK